MLVAVSMMTSAQLSDQELEEFDKSIDEIDTTTSKTGWVLETVRVLGVPFLYLRSSHWIIQLLGFAIFCGLLYAFWRVLKKFDEKASHYSELYKNVRDHGLGHGMNVVRRILDKVSTYTPILMTAQREGIRIHAVDDEMHPVFRDLLVELLVLTNFLKRFQIYCSKDSAVKEILIGKKDKKGNLVRQGTGQIEDELKEFRNWDYLKYLTLSFKNGSGKQLLPDGNPKLTPEGRPIPLKRVYTYYEGGNEITKDIEAYGWLTSIRYAAETRVRIGKLPLWEAAGHKFVLGTDPAKKAKEIYNDEISFWQKQIEKEKPYFDKLKRLWGLHFILESNVLEMADQYNCAGMHEHSYRFAKPSALLIGGGKADKDGPFYWEVDDDGNFLFDSYYNLDQFGEPVKPDKVRSVRRLKDPIRDSFMADAQTMALCIGKEWEGLLRDMRWGIWHGFSRTAEDYIIFHNYRIFDDYRILRKKDPSYGNPAVDLRALNNPGKLRYWGRKRYTDEFPTIDMHENPDPVLSTLGYTQYIADYIKQRVENINSILESDVKRWRWDAGRQMSDIGDTKGFFPKVPPGLT